MSDYTAFTIGTRVVDCAGQTGTVIETPWEMASGWTCKIEWDDNTITPSGTTNERTAELTII